MLSDDPSRVLVSADPYPWVNLDPTPYFCTFADGTNGNMYKADIWAAMNRRGLEHFTKEEKDYFGNGY